MYIQGNYGVIASGGIARDSEFKQVGANNIDQCRFSINIGRDKDGNAKYLNCTAWYELAKVASAIRKDDFVLAGGRLNKHEYNGKEYTDLSCDFVQVVHPAANVPAPQSTALPAGIPVGAGFQTVDEDELPF